MFSTTERWVLPGGSAHVSAWCRSVRPLRDGEVHPDRLPVQLLAVHHLPGLRGVLNGLKVDEGKASAAARVSVQDNLALLNTSKGAKVLLELPLGGVKTQAEHTEALVGLGSLSICSSASASTTGRRVIVTLKQKLKYVETRIKSLFSLALSGAQVNSLSVRLFVSIFCHGLTPYNLHLSLLGISGLFELSHLSLLCSTYGA